MSSFNFTDTTIDGLKLVQRKTLEDSRGFLSRFFCASDYASYGFNKNISQINHTLTKKSGTLRGMHFQISPFAEAKVVSCLSGEIFDVAVDIRKDSPTFLNWYGVILSAENKRSLMIPEGFAHGFQTLTDNCELVYLHSAPYNKQSEGGINALDPRLNISWPLPVTDLSDRDKSHPMIKDSFEGIEV